MSEEPVHRRSSYGQLHSLSALDQLGVALSVRKIRSRVGSLDGRSLGDFGCGYDALLARSFLGHLARATLLDVALSSSVKSLAKVTAIEGVLPLAMREVPDSSLDVALCISVLEHLSEPEEMLKELRRVLVPGGSCVISVPSWFGKRFLEFAAFTLKRASPEEMDDHKCYYDPKDLWPLLVDAGFLPHDIKCFRYKAGMNTFALCRVPFKERTTP
jgi:2-polyprenyl-3-methyl-5-hydroxy-6-metoxy-1,4-benzoquinol methylase